MSSSPPATHAPRPSLWSRAAAVAAQTPESRNRYVDFLRAVSILAVICGHWLMAAPQVIDGELGLGDLLAHQPWTRWLTWVFQVMPIFFLVGGYANGVSWSAAQRDGRSYSDWLNARLGRLIGPVIPLLVAWAALTAAAQQFGVQADLVGKGSKMALIPIWFLSVYMVVVLLVPLTYAAWRRFGLGSFWILALAAAADDLLFFADYQAFGWFNYLFIWLAVHQLGYAWREGHLVGLRKTLPWALGGLALLVGLVRFGPYPLSMVSVAGEAVSNSFPPKLPMLALGIFQSGLLLSLESPVRRWLARAGPWTATLIINGMIMTIYLWHLTASTLIIGLALVLGNVGLTVEPGSGTWWLARPLWFIIYLAALSVLALALGRFERGGAAARPPGPQRQVVGAAMVCAGLAFSALGGLAGDGWLGLRIWVLFLPIGGAVLAGILSFGRHTRRDTP